MKGESDHDVNSFVDETTLPGAFHMQGMVEQLPNVLNESAADDRYENSLWLDIEDVEEMMISTGSELIVDGVLVPKLKQKQPYAIFFLVVLITIIASILVIETPGKPRDLNNIQDSENGMFLPTTFFSDYVKNLVIPISGEDALNDVSSPQHYAWKKIAYYIPSLDIKYSSDEIIQRYAVLVVQLSLSRNFRDAYNLQTNRTFELCDAFTCNEKREITVFIQQNEDITGLGGGIIAKEIGELKGLIHLVLPKNGLKGTIPSEIGKLSSLRTLDLQSNSLTGDIPNEFGNLVSIEWMMLNRNELISTIPWQITRLSNIIFCDLSQNFFSGTIPFEMNSCDRLRGLALYRNKLNGTIEFLCKHNFTNEVYEQKSELGKSHFIDQFYTFRADFGLKISCDLILVSPCTCCTCVE